jgi:hypothetical protein
MTRVTWDGGADYEMVLDARCDASPTAVYDVLADSSTHLDWGGRRQRRGFRLTSLEAAGPMQAGSEFTSIGTIPMSTSRWEDSSVVVRAEPPRVLEFHTDGVVTWPSGRRTRARWEHRYEIEPDLAGSRVAYSLRRTAMTDAPLRMRMPVMRSLTHRVMIPLLCRRGFLNLLKAAEQRTGLARVG